jgi:hypothetical protein
LAVGTGSAYPQFDHAARDVASNGRGMGLETGLKLAAMRWARAV